MNGSLEGIGSSRPSPRNPGEEHMSMFFDFSIPAHQDGQQSFHSMESLASTSQDGPEPSQRAGGGGGIRVSLACIPCRSRHVKCGAEMPNCSRCVQDDKPCFYAKSRRGMRDRNAPRKRASLRESGKTSPAGAKSVYNNPLAYPVGGSSSESYTGPPSDASATGSPSSSTSRISGRQANPSRLLDLYYNFFHKAHPYVLPRYYFLTRLESDPESLKYLLPVMHYIGSLYAPDISSSDLREHALQQLDHSHLPPNGFTVLALLLSGIAIHAEDDFVQGRAILDRAIYMALEIRMNSRTFANMERDPVLAESWRRVYWGLYITDSTFAGIRQAPSFLLYTIESSVELPCEECDYDGIIPRPRTLSDYEARDFEDEETVFSSFTYLIDLTRISGSLLGFDDLRGKDLGPAVAHADSMLVNWRLHLPREKQGVVDKNEDVDELLFQAHNLLQLLHVYIHRPLSRLYHSPIESHSTCAPPPPLNPSLPTHPSHQQMHPTWLHTRKTLQAAEAAINLYALPIPILQHSPLGICGIALSTLANLSACAYVLEGPEWYRTRDRIRLGLGGLKKFGEVWRAARQTERETKRIAREVFALPRPGENVNGNGNGNNSNGAENGRHLSIPLGNGMGSQGLQAAGGGGLYDFELMNQGIHSMGGVNDGVMTGFEDMSGAGVDYLSILENAQVMNRV